MKDLDRKLRERIKFHSNYPSADLPEELLFTEQEQTYLLALQYDNNIDVAFATLLDAANFNKEIKLNAFKYREMYLYVAPAPYEALLCGNGNLAVCSEDLLEDLYRLTQDEPNPPEIITDLTRQQRRQAQRLAEHYFAGKS